MSPQLLQVDIYVPYNPKLSPTQPFGFEELGLGLEIPSLGKARLPHQRTVSETKGNHCRQYRLDCLTYTAAVLPALGF